MAIPEGGAVMSRDGQEVAGRGGLGLLIRFCASVSQIRRRLHGGAPCLMFSSVVGPAVVRLVLHWD